MSEEKKDSIVETTESTTVVNKKKFKVAGKDAYGMHYLGFEGGGEMPAVLKGEKFTSLKDAELKVELLNKEII